MTGKRSRKGDGRVAFLANVDKFREMLSAGYPQRSIYDDHASILGISYSQFNRYVGKYLLAKEGDHEHKIKQASLRVSQVAPALITNSEQTSAPPHPFVHNPSSGNDRNDLI